MNQTKVAMASVDAERLVRELLTALNSIKTTAANAVGRAHEGDPQPMRSESARVQLVRDVSQDENIESGEAWIEGSSNRLKLVEEFRGDYELIERLRVTEEELDGLSRVSLLGALTCKQDLLFVLRQIREANEPAGEEALAAPQDLLVPCREVEPSIPDVSEMTERIRREALAKMAETDSMQDTGRRKQIRVLSSFRTILGGRRPSPA